MNDDRGHSRGGYGTSSWPHLGGRAVMLAGQVLALALAGALLAVARAQQPVTTAKFLVFDGVTVVDVEQGKLRPAQRVVIAGTRIQAVGSGRAVRLPPDAQVIDASGKYLIPGLWDLHTHARYGTDLFYPLLLANGVTGIRDAGSPVPLDTLLQWRREILAGTRVGPPRQLLSGPSITDAGEPENCDRAAIRRLARTWIVVSGTCVGDAADARHFVDSLTAAGADLIKPRDVTQAMYFVLAAAARRRGIPFGGHIQHVSALDASDSGARLIDHRDKEFETHCWAGTASASVARCQPVAARLRRNGTWWVPTMLIEPSKPPRAQAIATYLTERAGQFWAGAPLAGNWLRAAAVTADSLGAMHIVRRTGLPILTGTDVGESGLPRTLPGFALHAELAMYVAEGLTPGETLRAATFNPAQMLHATDSLGTVAPGKLADLVLLDADPLADITNTTTVRAVVANGRYYDRAALDRMVTGVQAKAQEGYVVPVGRLAGQTVAVLPVRAIKADRDTAALRVLADSLLAVALAERAPAVSWVLPAVLRDSASRRPGLLKKPDALRGREDTAAVRQLVTAAGGWVVLIPEEVAFRPVAGGGVRADLQLSLRDVRTGEPLWGPRYWHPLYGPLVYGQGETPTAALAAALTLMLPRERPVPAP